MILITVGSHQLPFKKMNELVKILVNSMPEETFVYQTGHTSFLEDYPNLKTISFTSIEDFSKLVKEADLIITHGGINSVIDALLLKKPVIIFPRRSEYAEHNDNHQLQITTVFAEKNYAYQIDDYQNILEVVNKILNKEIQFNHFVTNNLKMINLIKNYIGENTNE